MTAFGRRARLPWKECKPMDQRLRFVARLLEGKKMAPLCREFGISRVTGYKIFNRYKDCGPDGLNDHSRAPYRQANRPSCQVARAILGIKKEHDTWGNLSTAYAGQTVGIREVEDQISLVSFLGYDLGYFDNERGRVEPGQNPFVPEKVLAMSPE